jgi:diguanylate cyclase
MKKSIKHNLVLLGILEMIPFSFYIMDFIHVHEFIVYSVIFLLGFIGIYVSSHTPFPINVFLLFRRYGLGRFEFIKKVNSQIASSRSSKENNESYIFTVDVDRSRWIHNLLGYQLGTQLLNGVVHRLLDVLDEDSFITRYSSDQFLLFIPKHDAADNHEKVAEKILQRLNQPYRIRGTEVNITCSVGISLYPEHGSTAEELLSKANFALHLAKENGGNQHYTFRYLDEEATKTKMIMEKELRKALKNNQFSINYQPQISLQTEKICGAEALLRWNHPTLGNVSPAEFIPLAEETGLIGQLGEFVLKNAAKQFKVWESEGVELESISVNISMAEFLNEDLISSVVQTLKEINMDPGKLKLEITESMAMHERDTVLKKLNGLKNTGIQLAIDDFGTGYSSLRYLDEFPVDYLKVDQSFVRHIKKAEQESVITRSIVQMAKGLHLKVVAEGVETFDQLAYVKNLGCDEFQGYFHSPPLTAEAFKTNFMNMNQKNRTTNEFDGLLLV